MTCISNVCSCEPVNLVWYSSYSGGGGIISGRCMRQRTEGQQYLPGVCASNQWAGGYFRSPISICQFTFDRYLSFTTGGNIYGGNILNKPCTNSLECAPYWQACMNIDGDSYKKCTPLPTLFYLAGLYGYGTKQSYGQPCNLYLKCNEFKNLKCTNYFANSGVTASCTCFGKYQYWNSTVTTGTTAYNWGMCINGKRYLSYY